MPQTILPSEALTDASCDTAQGAQRFFVSHHHHLAVAGVTQVGKSLAGAGLDHLLTRCVYNSRQALKKYVLANNNLAGVSDAVFTAQFNRALQKGSDSGVFARPKGTSNRTIITTPYRLLD